MEGENIIADVRFRAVNWGRENPQSHEGGGRAFPRSEIREQTGERAAHSVLTIHCSEGISWVTLGETVLLPEYLEEDILPLQGQKARWELVRSPSTSGTELL